ncbi:unnamed protein product [Sphagnum balticum]
MSKSSVILLVACVVMLGQCDIDFVALYKAAVAKCEETVSLFINHVTRLPQLPRWQPTLPVSRVRGTGRAWAGRCTHGVWKVGSM